METYMFFCKHVHESTVTCILLQLVLTFDPHWKRVHCIWMANQTDVTDQPNL